MTGGFNGADLAALVNKAVSMVLQAYIAEYPRPEDAKEHLTEAIVAYEHFQEAAKKVRSSRESKPMEKGLGSFLQVRQKVVRGRVDLL